MEKIATVPFIIDSNQPNILFSPSSILDRYAKRFANTNLPSSFHCFKVEWTRSKILPLSETNKLIKTICKTRAQRHVNIVNRRIHWVDERFRSILAQRSLNRVFRLKRTRSKSRPVAGGQAFLALRKRHPRLLRFYREQASAASWRPPFLSLSPFSFGDTSNKRI